MPMIYPQTDRILLHLQLTTSLAHGEAGSQSTGPNNLTLFHRQLALLPTPTSRSLAGDPLPRLDAVCRAWPLGDELGPFCEALTGPQLLGCLFLAVFPLMYGEGDGTGLFSGIARYQYLSTRVSDALVTSSTLAEVFTQVARHLQLMHPAEEWHDRLLPFFVLMPQSQAVIIQALQSTLPLCVMGAREVVESWRCTHEAYAKKAKRPHQAELCWALTPAQQADFALALPERQAVMLPAVSGNALRHILLRAPGATRLLQALGLDPVTCPIPVGVERFLFGGGNTAAKVTAPGNADLLEATTRRNYPLVDALGGAVDRFLFSRSQVSIASWLLCREHNAATEAIAGLTSQVSLLDTIAETTRTRMGIGGKDKESGQMIFTYEVLPPGTELLVEIRLQPWTAPLTKGATQQAVQDWLTGGACLGAKTAQGHGRCLLKSGELPYEAESAAYLAFLAADQERLAAGLTTGTFGTEVVLCAQT